MRDMLLFSRAQTVLPPESAPDSFAQTSGSRTDREIANFQDYFWVSLIEN